MGESQIQNDNSGALVSAINADTSSLNIQPTKVAAACPPGFIYVDGTVVTLSQSTIDNAVTNGHTGLFLEPSVTHTVAGPLTVPTATHTPFVIRSSMYGGSAYGDTNCPPPHFVSFSNSTGDGFVIPDNAAKVRLEGIAVEGTTTGSLVHINGARQSGLVDCYVWNKNTSAGYAVVQDTSTGGCDSEDNDSHRCYLKGWRALGLGISNPSYNANDSLWDSITTSGVDAGVHHATGGNHTFFNWYDRSNPATAAYHMTGGEATLIGGEDRNTVADMIKATGGELWLMRRAFTQSTGTGIHIAGGTVFMAGCRSNTFKVYVSSGFLQVERDCYFGTATLDLSGGTVYHPTVWNYAWTRDSTTGGTYTSY